MPNLTGQSIGRYQILEQLGEGGMAIVYKAYDTRLERNVALKVLRTDQFIPAQLPMVLQRFEREAKSLAKLKNSNIVNILDFGEHEGMPYLVMEYLPGGTLKQKLSHAVPWQEAIQTLLPVARGLSYAHQHGVIHRDVKPANVLIDENGEPILTDFGIAKLLEGANHHTLTGSGVGIGTPEYMAPEQGIGASTIDARADIYSVGIVLYEMVTGRRPYIADTPMAVVLKHMTDPLPRPTIFVPELPEGVEHILLKALAKEANDRYENMDALIAAMQDLLAKSKKSEDPEPEVISPAKRVKKIATPHVMPSSKAIKSAIGVFAFILVIVFGAPWVKQKLSALPPGTATLTTSLPILSTSTPIDLPTTETPAASTPLILRDTPFPAPQARKADGMVMVYIPAGTFQMGSDNGDADERPIHGVSINAFWIDQHEVTNGMYKRCVEAGVCKNPTSPVRYSDVQYADFPVVHVDWERARAYCEWVGSSTGIGATRLPSEAEWEYAARGALAGKPYPWGDKAPGCTRGAENGTNSAECSKGIMAVKSFQPNGYGLFDMAGNVFEWVNDWYDASYYLVSPVQDPLGPPTGQFRVVRDASWYAAPSTVFVRDGTSPEIGDYGVGFRCAGRVDGGVPQATEAR